MPLHASDPVPVVSISGTPHERGRQHGGLIPERVQLGADQLQTIASIVVDCSDRERRIAFGPPDESGYERYTFAAPAPETALRAESLSA
jgi:hypothetical protein